MAALFLLCMDYSVHLSLMTQLMDGAQVRKDNGRVRQDRSGKEIHLNQATLQLFSIYATHLEIYLVIRRQRIDISLDGG